MRDLIRLVDEATLNEEGTCSLCESREGPFLEVPLPARLMGAATYGAWYLCSDCYESALNAAVDHVVSKQRFDAVNARAVEAEGRLVSLDHRAKADAEKIAQLEHDLVQTQGRLTAAEGERDSANRQFAEISKSPAVLEREALLARIEARAAETKTKSSRKPKATV
ncbi:MAG: hypothetical protein ACJ752_00580 [Gaiellaceae bacterium]